MPQMNFVNSISGGGVQISGNAIRDTDSVSGLTPTLPKGKAGSLTTRTDDNTGVATLGASHGIVTSDVVDVYWSGGRRYGMTTTVSGNDVTIDGGTGDDLPTQGDPVVLTKQVRINLGIDGDLLAGIALKLEFTDPQSANRGHISFFDTSNVQVTQLDLTANEAQPYDVAGGAANPFTGNPITYAKATNGGSDADGTLKLIIAQDSTP
jgi:hypothetical protein